MGFKNHCLRIHKKNLEYLYSINYRLYSNNIKLLDNFRCNITFFFIIKDFFFTNKYI